MKVIENNHNEKTSWHAVCDKCDSVLEYSKEDATIKESHFFYLHYINCPCCGASIDVKHW